MQLPFMVSKRGIQLSRKFCCLLICGLLEPLTFKISVVWAACFNITNFLKDSNMMCCNIQALHIIKGIGLAPGNRVEGTAKWVETVCKLLRPVTGNTVNDCCKFGLISGCGCQLSYWPWDLKSSPRQWWKVKLWRQNSGFKIISELKELILPINLLAPDFFFLILAHPVYKMWIIRNQIR